MLIQKFEASIYNGLVVTTPQQDLRLAEREKQYCSKHALRLRASPSIFIYNFSFQYPRWEAISPEVCVLALMLRTDCSFFTIKAAHPSRLLPQPS